MRSGKKSPSNGVWYMDDDRTPYSYKYIGEYNQTIDNNDVVLYEQETKKEESNDYEQMLLF
jgi:hypothetical protein